MTENEIISFLSNKNYDIRVHNNARWIYGCIFGCIKLGCMKQRLWVIL